MGTFTLFIMIDQKRSGGKMAWHSSIVLYIRWYYKDNKTSAIIHDGIDSLNKLIKMRLIKQHN